MTARARGGVVGLVLREPPSANRWWRNVSGRMVTSRAAREYKQHVGNALLVARVRKIAAPTPVAVTLTWYRGRRSGDLDKRLGVLLDALQGCAYDTDAQVVRIDATRRDDPGKPRVEITLDPCPVEGA